MHTINYVNNYSKQSKTTGSFASYDTEQEAREILYELIQERLERIEEEKNYYGNYETIENNNGITIKAKGNLLNNDWSFQLYIN